MTSPSSDSLEFQRARKVGQIRALTYVEGYVRKQRHIEEAELKKIERQLNHEPTEDRYEGQD